MEAAGQTGSILGKHPASDESNQQSLKKSCADRGANKGRQVKSIQFVNQTTDTFTIRLSDEQNVKDFCPICHDDKITANPACKNTKSHVMCEVCIENYLSNPNISGCPECRGQKTDEKYIDDNVMYYRSDLDKGDIICDKCSLSVTFEEAQTTHSHREPPSADPFYKPSSLKTPLPLGAIEKKVTNIMTQIRKYDPKIFHDFSNFFSVLMKDQPMHDLLPRRLERLEYYLGMDISMASIIFLLFQEFLQSYFIYRETIQNPLTLEEIKTTFRLINKGSLADSLVWSDEADASL